jgi:N6-L-threonylcarbamoyladenine synthase
VPGLDFSFSGLKTALLYTVRNLSEAELAARRADLAAAYQHAIVRALVERVEAAGANRVAVVGGVAANSELRSRLADAALAPLPLCTDNAAMIASAARFTRAVPYPQYLSLDARAAA